MDLLNSSVWIENHPTLGWCPGRVESLNENSDYTVLDEEGTHFTVEKSKAIVVEPCCLKGVDNLLSLGDFNEGALLENIRVRYFEDKIYTGIGTPILISLNPYMTIPRLYGPDTMMQYAKSSQIIGSSNSDSSDSHLKSNLSPHLFSVAAECYQTMLTESANQSIIITGESGAGKTEATKRILNYLANIQKHNNNTNIASSPTDDGVSSSTTGAKGRERKSPVLENSSDNSIENQVLRSNPILEAFGNAKTVRNDNSSRFGKFIEITFQSGRLKTANIRNYLLEKCRITSQQEGERNYHAFYFLLCGVDEEMRKSLYLEGKGADDFEFTACCTEIDNVDDMEEYLEVENCLHRLSFSHDEITTLWKCCAAILHLGNLEFDMVDEKQGPNINNPESLQPVCDLLGIERDAIQTVLRSKKFYDPISKNMILTPLRLEQAYQVKLSIARVLYSKMFDWLVKRINLSMQEKDVVNTSGGKTKSSGDTKGTTMSSMIGLLDIYGFEVFEWNSFEQLCINFANEKLQQHFNSHMFNLEQKMYSDENINWSQIEWRDNSEIIDALEKRPNGIFPHLDSTCQGPNATDAAFLQALYTKVNKPNIVYNPSKQKTNLFGVLHYAGEVLYSVTGFLDKNFEKQIDEAVDVLKGSTNNLICTFVTQTTEQNNTSSSNSNIGGGTSGSGAAGGAARNLRGNRAGVPQRASRTPLPGASARSSIGTDKIKGPQGTVSSTFREQLDSLVVDLNQTHPRYIRCIKPNANKQSHDFDSLDVLRQLRCAGMLESIRIRHAGYPVRRQFREFAMKYGRLHPQINNKSLSSGISDFKPICEKILNYVTETKTVTSGSGSQQQIDKMTWQVGRSKVFLKEFLQRMLDEDLNLLIRDYVTLLSKSWRRYNARKIYLEKRKAALEVQTFIRTTIQYQKTQIELKKKRATIQLQSFVKTVVASRIFHRKRHAINLIQRIARGRAIRKKLGDFRRIKNERDADRARQKIENDRREQERKEKEAKLEQQNAEMEEKLKEMEQSIERRAKEEAEITRMKIEKEEQERQENERKRKEEDEKRRKKQEEERIQLEQEAAANAAAELAKKQAEAAAAADLAKKQADEIAEKARIEREEIAEKAKQEKQELEQKLAEQKENLEKTLEEKDKANQVAAKENEEKVALKDENVLLKDENEKLKDKITELESEKETRNMEFQHEKDNLEKTLQAEVSKLHMELMRTSAGEDKLDALREEYVAKEIEKDNKIDDLDKQLQESKFVIEGLEKKNTHLQELCDSTADMERDKVGGLEKIIRELKETLSDALSARDASNIELELTKKKLDEFLIEKKEYQKSIEELQEAVHNANSAAVAAAKNAAVMATQKNSKPTSIDEVNLEMQNSDGPRETIAKHQEFLSLLEQTRAATQNSNIPKSSDSLTKTVENDSTTSGDLTKVRKQLQERNVLLAERNAAYKDLVDEFQIKKEENRRLLSEISSIKAEKARLEERVKATVSLDEYTKVQNRLTELENSNARLTFSLTNAEKQKASLEDTITELEQNLEKKRKEGQEQAAILRKYELGASLSNASDSNNLNNNPNGSSQGLNTSKSPSPTSNLASDAKSAAEAAASATAESRRLEADKAKAESRYQELKRINVEFMDHMKTAQQNLIKKTEELRLIRSEKQRIEKQKDELESKLQNLHEQHDASQGTNSYYERKIQEQREEVTKLRQDNKLLTANETYYKIEIDKYKSLLDGVKERNHQLTIENSKSSKELLDKTIA